MREKNVSEKQNDLAKKSSGNRAKTDVFALCKTAVLAALLAVLSQISIPLPSGVPITLQTFAVAFGGFLFGWLGVVAVLVYLCVGALGAPVFASFKGGVAAFAGLTGGFLLGFLPFSFCCAVGKNKSAAFNILLGIAGVLLCHVAGVVQYVLLSGVNLWQGFLTVSFLYIPKDVLSVIAAYFCAKAVEKALLKNNVKTDYVILKSRRSKKQ